MPKTNWRNSLREFEEPDTERIVPVRTRKRIKQIMRGLRKVWLRNPGKSLDALLWPILGDAQPIPDEKFIKRLEEYWLED